MKNSSISRRESGDERRSVAYAEQTAQAMRTGAAAMPDARAASLTQLQHQQRASSSSQAVQLMACADMMAGRSADPPVQRVDAEQPAHIDGAPVAQLKTIIGYEPQTLGVSGGVEQIGKKMVAYLDPDDPIKGAKTNATEIPLSMDYFSRVYPNRTAGWHRGHLLNARLGGLNIGMNLVPIPNSMNTGAHSDIEEIAKRLVGIGVPSSYRASYDFEEAEDSGDVRITLEAGIEPLPRDDGEHRELEKRLGVRGLQVRMEAEILGKDVVDRPSSPQATETTALDERPYVSGEPRSAHNDTRIAEKGWGILKNENGNEVSLTKTEQSDVVKTLAPEGNVFDRETLGRSTGYEGRAAVDKERHVDEAWAWLNENMPDAVGLIEKDAYDFLDEDEEARIDGIYDQFERRNRLYFKVIMDYFHS